MNLTVNEKTLKIDRDVGFATWLLKFYPDQHRKGDSVGDMVKRIIVDLEISNKSFCFRGINALCKMVKIKKGRLKNDR